MTAELLNRFFIPVFLAVGFSMKLWGSRGSTDRSVRYYWLTIFSIVILIAADALESWAQRDPGLVLFRTAFTVIGYVMRPVAALSIVLIIYPKEHRPWLLWIPVLVNLAVYITAFFSPAAFSFSEEYGFVRGPLGRTVVWVSFFYIFCAVWITGKRYRKKDHIGERFILYLCAAACIAAAVIDMKTDGDHLNSAILISSIFLYMFRRSIDTNRDVLTKLLNRTSFYEDCRRFNPSISAIRSASVLRARRISSWSGRNWRRFRMGRRSVTEN